MRSPHSMSYGSRTIGASAPASFLTTSSRSASDRTRRPRGATAGCGYAAMGGPNQVVSASGSPKWVPSPTQATYPSGRITTAVGAVTAPSTGSSHTPTYSASISWTRPHTLISRLTEVEQHRLASCSSSKLERAPGGHRSRSGMRRPATGVPRRGRSECPARTSSRRTACAARHAQQLGHGVAQRIGPLVVPLSAICAIALCSTRAPPGAAPGDRCPGGRLAMSR